MYYGIKNGKIVITAEKPIKSMNVDRWVRKADKYLKQKQFEELQKQADVYRQRGYNVKIDEQNQRVEIIKDQKRFEIELQKINQRFDQTIANLTKKYPIAEKLTWETKRIEAEKVLAGQSSPYLENLVKERLQTEGIDLNQVDLKQEVQNFAQKILQKAQQYAQEYAKLEAEKNAKIKKLILELQNNQNG